MDARRDDDPAPANKPRICRLGDEALPGAMQRQHRLLFVGLDRARNVRSAGPRFLVDRPASAASFLLVFTVGFTNQGPASSPYVRISNSSPFHGAPRRKASTPIRHGSNWAKNGKTLRVFQLLLSTTRPRLVNAMKLKHVLCQIQSDRRHLHRGRLLS